MLRQQVHMAGSSHRPEDLGLESVRHALSREKLRPTVGQLDDDGPHRLGGSLSITALAVLVPVTLTAGRA